MSEDRGLIPEQVKRLARLVSPESLELILLPTERCNFRCTYCYEDFAHGRMSPPVVDGVKALLDRRAPALSQLHLSWFGGEPLAAADIVLDVSRHAKKLASQHPGLTYVGSATTNGFLLRPELLIQLVEAGVTRFQVSLDGPRAVHDQRRKRANGGPTFDVIWENLLAARATSVEFSMLLRIHFDAETASLLGPLIDDCQREFLDDQRFEFIAHPVQALGGPNDQELQVLDPSEEDRVTKQIQGRLTHGAVRDPIRAVPQECYAGLPTSLVIRSTGRLAKCTVALRDSRNDVGEILSDGTLRIDSARLSPWFRGLTTLDADVMACPLKDLPRSRAPEKLLPLLAAR